MKNSFLNRREFLYCFGSSIICTFLGNNKASAFICLDEISYGTGIYGEGSYGIYITKIVKEFSESWLSNDECFDFNLDGIVNFIDYVFLLNLYGE